MNTDKRSRDEMEDAAFGGITSLPDDHVAGGHLANILTLVPIICRHRLGLMNKTALVDFEICKPYRLFLQWFRRWYKALFRMTVGSTFAMSFDRVSGIQVTRAVASCMNTTVMMHLCRGTGTVDEACIAALSDMQSSALTLAKCGCAIKEMVGASVDTNLLGINGVIKRECC